jgi:hypothetical protein
MVAFVITGVIFLTIWTIVVNRLTARAYIDYYEKTNEKKKEERTVTSYMRENYGSVVAEWFRYDKLVFWSYTDSLNRLTEKDILDIRNMIIKQSAIDILKKLQDKNKKFNGKYYILVPLLESDDGKTISWSFQYLGNEDFILGKEDNDNQVDDVDTAKVIKDYSELLNK